MTLLFLPLRAILHYDLRTRYGPLQRRGCGVCTYYVTMSALQFLHLAERLWTLVLFHENRTINASEGPMKPEFALSLSFDAVTLLFRRNGEWRRVGEVPLGVEDLPTELALLRSKAEELATGAIRSKLIIPNEQIRYLTVETGRKSHKARLKAARIALEGATPYDVADLAFDISAEGAKTHIAAVAIETLDEAEAFALEHEFGPVSFVAVPQDTPFAGEPLFGTARAARGMDIDHDDQPVHDSGPIHTPLETTDTHAEKQNAAELALTPNPAAKIVLPAAPPLVQSEGAAASDRPPLSASPPAKSKEPASDLLVLTDSDMTGVAVAPQSNDAQDNAAKGEASTSGHSRDDHEDEDAPGPIVGFSTRRRIDANRLTATSGSRSTTALRPRSRPLLAILTDNEASLRTCEDTQEIPPAPKVVMPSLSHTTSAPPKPDISMVPSPPQTSTLAQVPHAHPLRSRPRMLGFAALCIMGTVALCTWLLAKELPVLWSDLKRADLIDAKDPVAPPIILQAPVAATTTQATPTLTPPQTLSADVMPFAPAEDNVPRLAPPSGLSAPQRQSPNEQPAHQQPQNDTAFAPESAMRATLAAPEGEDMGLLNAQELVIASLPAPTRLSPRSPSQPTQTSDSAPFAQGSDATLADDQSAVSEEQIEALQQAARYAATGIWQTPPEISKPPALIHFDDLYVASIDHTNLSQDAIALPDTSALKTDVSLGPIASPTEAGRTFALDTRGLVTATPEGTLNPDGILVFSGLPDTRPPAAPARPSASDTEAAEKLERDKELAQVRPRLRPVNLSEQIERAQLGGLSRRELTALRPKLRPKSLKTEQEENQPATSSAIAVAQSPRARPTNFANIVDRARARAAAQAPAATSTAAATPSRSPQIPSSASVARQATVRGAINLRRLNLIGVAGSPSDRRALVRLPSGRVVELQIGDRIDGGHVVAIGESQLQYQKGGKNNTLSMPKG